MNASVAYYLLSEWGQRLVLTQGSWGKIFFVTWQELLPRAAWASQFTWLMSTGSQFPGPLETSYLQAKGESASQPSSEPQRWAAVLEIHACVQEGQASH